MAAMLDNESAKHRRQGHGYVPRLHRLTRTGSAPNDQVGRLRSDPCMLVVLLRWHLRPQLRQLLLLEVELQNF